MNSEVVGSIYESIGACADAVLGPNVECRHEPGM